MSDTVDVCKHCGAEIHEGDLCVTRYDDTYLCEACWDRMDPISRLYEVSGPTRKSPHPTREGVVQ